MNGGKTPNQINVLSFERAFFLLTQKFDETDCLKMVSNLTQAKCFKLVKQTNISKIL